jgi:hypothetical protein
MTFYSCEIKGSGATLDAYLNEYHLYSSGGASHGYSSNIRAWMEKENLIRVKVGPSDKAKPGESVQFSVLASVMEGGRQRILAQMSFPRGIAAPTATSIPFDTLGKRLAVGNNLNFTCDPQVVVEKPWRTTDRFITNPPDIYELYAKIQQNFLEGNVDGIMALSSARIAFGAKLYDQKPEDYEQDIRADLTSTFADHPTWKVVKQPERNLTVHEFLPNKVVRILDLNGDPPLRTVADKDGIQSGYDIIIAITAEGLVWIM